jgi:hypothetical protein
MPGRNRVIATARRLMTSRYFVVTLESGDLVRLKRTECEFRVVQELETERVALEGVLGALAKNNLTLLVDMRDGPASVSVAFEPAFRRLAKATQGFLREAILVETELGAVRAERVIREAAGSASVFTSESDALEYLRKSRASGRFAVGPR